MNLLRFVLTLMLGVAVSGTRAGAYEACYYNNFFPGPFSPLQAFVPYPDVDVWLDNSFYNAGSIGGIPTADAERLAQQVVARFQSEAGSAFNLRWRGRSENKVCIADRDIWPSTQFERPTIIIDGDPTGEYCEGRPACGWFEPVYNYAAGAYGTSMNCGRVTFNISAAFTNGTGGAGGSDFTTSLLHEIGHVFKLNHQDTCGTTADDNTVMQYTYSIPTPQSHLTRADKRYYRIDYGYGQHDVLLYDPANGFAPPQWGDESPVAGALAIGPYGTADSRVPYRGFAYNRHIGGNQPEVRAAIPEASANPTLSVVSNWDSYHRPDIALGHGPPSALQWMVVFLFNDSPESTTKQIRAVFKTAETGQPWTETTVPGATTTKTSIAAAYDPISNYFVIAYLDSSSQIVFQTKKQFGNSWSTPQTTAPALLKRAFDGADIACSAFSTFSEGAVSFNCEAVYVELTTSGTSGIIRHFPFLVRVDNPGTPSEVGTIVMRGTTYSAGLYGFSRPSVSASPVDEDPRFVYAFNQASEAQWYIVYTRTQNRNALNWHGAAPLNAPSGNWFRPAAVGSRLGLIPIAFATLGDN
jgi:hypothetical protein